jgi:hypothetical protein
MKRNILIAFAATSLLFYSTQAYAALLNFSAGVPFSHSITGKSADGTTNVSDGTSGVFIQIGLPLLPGIGIDNYKTKLKQGACVGCWNIPIDLVTTMYNLYYLLPIPIVNLTIGVGTGKIQHSYGGVAGDDGPATQWYTSFGIPIIPLFDLHLSYRSISSKIESTSGSDKGTKYDYGGSVMGLGIGFNF